MLIVGDNLKSLIEQHAMIKNANNGNLNFDDNCIKLTLDNQVVNIEPTSENNTLYYQQDIPKELVHEYTLDSTGLILKPKSSVLACSKEIIFIPNGYMGFIQTTGSLARYFISVHFSDGQIDSGYEGKITFELFNGSDFNVVIQAGQPIANLYLFKTSTQSNNTYSGRYQKANKPTVFTTSQKNKH